MTLAQILAVPLVPMFLASAIVAVYAFERRDLTVVGIFKPLTTILLLGIVGRPGSVFSGLVWAGIVASVGGDVALLRGGNKAFLVGLALFLVAHVAYTAAFVSSGSWSRASWGGLLLIAVVTPLFLRMLWSKVSGLRGPVIAYAAAISIMVVAAFSTTGVPAGWLAAIGSVLFYVSDASLAFNRFVRPIRHPALLSVGVYWLGQLGIALAARSSIPGT